MFVCTYLSYLYFSFTVVADYFGRGVFNKLTVISGDGVAAEQKDLTPGQGDLSVASKSHLAAPSLKALPKVETPNYGPGAEAKLRLEEGYNSRQCEEFIFL